jgi:hypothetical protein
MDLRPLKLEVLNLLSTLKQKLLQCRDPSWLRTIEYAAIRSGTAKRCRAQGDIRERLICRDT